MARKTKKREDAHALLARGQGLVDVNNAEAELVLQRALAAATTGKLRGACHDALGILRRRTNDSDGAMTAFREAITSYRTDGDGPGEAHALVHLAGVEIDTGLREDAIAHLREALAVAEKQKQPALEAHVADVLSFALDAAGEHEEAEALAQRGFELLSKTGDKRQLGISLGNKAVQDQIAGRMKEAERGYLRALEISEAVGDLHNAAIVACNLSTLCVARGRFTEAEPYIQRGMALHEKIGNRAGVAHAALSLADIKSAQGDSLATIELQRTAIAQFHSAGNRHLEGVALGNMANEEMTLGRLEQALEHHKQSIELLRAVRQENSEGSTLTNMALVLAELGRVADGLDAAKRAREIFAKAKDGRWEGIAFLSIGTIQHLSDLEAARQSYLRGLELLEAAEDPSQTARALLGLAAIEIEEGKDASARLERAKELGAKAGERESALLAEALSTKAKEPPRGIIGRLLWKRSFFKAP
jgi:tetratricopeptide (TPR) repeat protein